MKVIHTITEMRAEIARVKSEGKSIGLVPTMGALHEGHLTLMRRASIECDFIVASVFVNPTQFGAGEDFEKYPRTLESDAAKCESSGVDFVFAPSAAEMYPEGFDAWVDVGGITQILEGAFRPTHFRGVTTVVAKFFNIITPNRAYFGMKDYQQLAVICKMVRDLNMGLEIVPVEIVREEDGFAMSSRNAYLAENERQAALILSSSLAKAKSAFESGERSAVAIQSLIEATITTEPLARIDYVEVVDAQSLEKIDVIHDPAVVLLAVRIGSTRLIDNCILK